MTSQLERGGTRAGLLIVEDNPGDARLFEEHLSEAGISNPIYHATTLEEALDVVNQRGEFDGGPAPDLIFLDWHLPRGTGDKIVEALQEGSGTVDAFTVVLTGSERDRDSVVPSDLGVDGYLTKPLDIDELVTLVESARELSFAPVEA